MHLCTRCSRHVCAFSVDRVLLLVPSRARSASPLLTTVGVLGVVVTGALYLFSYSGIQSTKSLSKEEAAMQTVADNRMDLIEKRVATGVMTRSRAEVGERIATIGALLLQYGLVLVSIKLHTVAAEDQDLLFLSAHRA